MKNRSRFSHFLNKREAHRVDEDAFALMLDTDGSIAAENPQIAEWLLPHLQAYMADATETRRRGWGKKGT